MAKKTVYFYYRIYDDSEQENYIRSTFSQKKIRSMLNRYEKVHSQYLNVDFVKFLKQHDPKAELIEVTRISY